MGQMTWSLTDPWLGMLERLGVAGMAAALAAAHEKQDLGQLTGEYDKTELVLRWPEGVTAREALTPLIKWAWQTRGAQSSDPKEGLGIFYFPAVHDEHSRDNASGRLVEHSGVMSTFLQHPRIQPRTKPKTGEHELGENQRRQHTFVEPAQLVRYVAEFDTLFVNKGKNAGALQPKPVAFSSFLFPGATSRYGKEQSWEGMPAQAIPLFFAPTLCFYFRMPPTDWVVVAPDVRDLEVMVRLRRKLSLKELESYAGSAADAALRAQSAMRGRTAARQLERRQPDVVECQVLQMGKVIWNKQNVRSNALRVSPTRENLDRYEVLERALPNQLRQTKEKAWFVYVPTPRGSIAYNLASDQYWYKDLFQIPRLMRNTVEKRRRPGESAARAWFRLLGYHRKELRTIMTEMSKHASNPDDEAFVQAFHAAMKSLFAQEAARAEQGSRSANERFADLVESTRREITRAQTRSLLRATLSRFWSRGGANKAVQEHGAVLWRLIDDPREWRRARDLALLSLVTYQGQGAKAMAADADVMEDTNGDTNGDTNAGSADD